MKKIFTLMLTGATVALVTGPVMAQPGTENLTLVNVQSMKTKWTEKGTMKERDSLIAIYNNNVVKKNEFILSHRELSHYFTPSSTDYLIIEEYKDYPSMIKAFDKFDELEKAAWPDEKKRTAFMDAMNSYFEKWHGDALYRSNPLLLK